MNFDRSDRFIVCLRLRFVCGWALEGRCSGATTWWMMPGDEEEAREMQVTFVPQFLGGLLRYDCHAD
jgi:hypothetical protein